MFKEDLTTFFKGFAMGAANVVPGVSGGTIAFITGIYQRLIDALKAFDIAAIKLLFGLKLSAFWQKIDGRFLLALMLGVGVSILTLAKVLKWGFEEHPTVVWSLFFGLITASIPSVGKMIRYWSIGVWIALALGLAAALSMVLLEPANENTNPVYLALCGVAAMVSMIIPGLSGSFVLLLMGNYELIFLDSVNNLREFKLAEALPILIPVALGAGIGMIALSRLLSWLFKRHHDVAVGAITGFVAGSLAVIWPWKDTLTETFQKGDEMKEKIVGFQNWHLPSFNTSSTWIELGAVIIGAALIFAIDFFAKDKDAKKE